MIAALLLIAAGTAGSAQAAANNAGPDAAAGTSPQSTSAAGPVSSDPAAYAAALRSPDWVKTPDGLMYKTCVHTLPAGASMHGDSEVLASGVKLAPFKPCPHPRLVTPAQAAAQSAAAKRAVAKPAFSTNGWLQASWWNAPNYLTGITSTYTVPSPPTTDGATNFFFSSLEPSAGDSIVQPVLTWGNGESDYYLTSWYVTGSNSETGQNVATAPGDTVTASVRASGCASDGTGCTWDIITQDNQSGQQSTLSVTTDESYTSAQGGTFESYGANGCDYFPSNGGINFSDIAVYDNNNAQTSPSFSDFVADQECNMSLNIDATSTTFNWSTS
ncbi:hypothetical protein [Catenulispora pinisilvae]|uniref:hypothetical protein n=1 Tax=Catenulispora pinisilvae TaxID=2705253 RepID=UPI001891C590|nr:hypothetical protein [Catenulispora pinisilvae]